MVHTTHAGAPGRRLVLWLFVLGVVVGLVAMHELSTDHHSVSAEPVSVVALMPSMDQLSSSGGGAAAASEATVHHGAGPNGAGADGRPTSGGCVGCASHGGAMVVTCLIALSLLAAAALRHPDRGRGLLVASRHRLLPGASRPEPPRPWSRRHLVLSVCRT